jgi:hypothetical protein
MKKAKRLPYRFGKGPQQIFYHFGRGKSAGAVDKQLDDSMDQVQIVRLQLAK